MESAILAPCTLNTPFFKLFCALFLVDTLDYITSNVEVQILFDGILYQKGWYYPRVGITQDIMLTL